MTWRTLIAAAASLVLASCAGSGPPQPTYGDAFTGLYNQSSTAVPADAPVTVRQPVAIIFSNNVEKWFRFVKDNNAYWASVVPSSLTNTAAVADADPNFVGGRVLEMLKRRFPNSEYVNDFGKAVASGKRSAVLVDVNARAAEPGDRTTRIDVALFFFDAQMNPVSRLNGHGEYHAAFGSMTGGIQPSVDAALAELDGKMNRLVH